MVPSQPGAVCAAMGRDLFCFTSSVGLVDGGALRREGAQVDCAQGEIKKEAHRRVRDVLDKPPRPSHMQPTHKHLSCMNASLSSRHSTWSRRSSLQEDGGGMGEAECKGGASRGRDR